MVNISFSNGKNKVGLEEPTLEEWKAKANPKKMIKTRIEDINGYRICKITFEKKEKCSCCKGNNDDYLYEEIGIECLELVVEKLNLDIINKKNEEPINKIDLELQINKRNNYYKLIEFYKLTTKEQEQLLFENFIERFRERQEFSDDAWDSYLKIEYGKSKEKLEVAETKPYNPFKTKCEVCGVINWKRKGNSYLECKGMNKDENEIVTDCGHLIPYNHQNEFQNMTEKPEERTLAQKWLGSDFNNNSSRISGITSKGRGHPYWINRPGKWSRGLSADDENLSLKERSENKYSLPHRNEVTKIIESFSRDTNRKKSAKKKDYWIPFGLFCHLQSEFNAPWSLADWVSNERTGTNLNSFIRYFKSSPKLPSGIHNYLSNSNKIHNFDLFINNRLNEINIEELQNKITDLQNKIKEKNNEIDKIKELYRQPEKNEKINNRNKYLKEHTILVKKLDFFNANKEKQKELISESYQSHLKDYFNETVIESFLVHLDYFDKIYDLESHQKFELKKVALKYLEKTISKGILNQFIEEFCIMHCENELVYVDYYIECEIKRKTVPILWIPVALSLHSAFRELEINNTRYSSDLDVIEKLIDSEIIFLKRTFGDHLVTSELLIDIWKDMTSE